MYDRARMKTTSSYRQNYVLFSTNMLLNKVENVYNKFNERFIHPQSFKTMQSFWEMLSNGNHHLWYSIPAGRLSNKVNWRWKYLSISCRNRIWKRFKWTLCKKSPERSWRPVQRSLKLLMTEKWVKSFINIHLNYIYVYKAHESSSSLF